MTEAGKRLLRGIERADSIGLDAHKWFFQPYEAGCLLVKEASARESPFEVRRAVSKGLELAARAGEYVGASPVMELLIPVSLGVVCFRINPADTATNEKVLEKINRQVLAHIFWENPAFISSTLLHGTFSLRLCIVNHTTT